MAKRLRTKETREIYRVLDFHLRHAPLGLLPFFDKKCQLPSTKEVFDILMGMNKYTDIGTKIQGGNMLPEQQIILERTEPYLGIIKKYGDIATIRKICSEYEKRYLEAGQFLRDWSKKGTGNLKTVTDIAIKNGYSDARSAYKMREKYLHEISYEIYMRNSLRILNKSDFSAAKRKKDNKSNKAEI